MNFVVHAFSIILFVEFVFSTPRYQETPILQKFLLEIGAQESYTMNNLCGVRNKNPLFSMNILKEHVKESEFDQFPWQGALLTKDKLDNWITACGASVFGSQWIITAAVCVEEFEPEDILVRVGDKNLINLNKPSLHIDAMVEGITILDNLMDPMNNVAILKLSKPLDMHYDHVNSICLPNPTHDFSGQHCIVTGWSMGRAPQYDLTGHLKKDVQIVLSHKQCIKVINNHKMSSVFDLSGSSGSICAIGLGDIGSCIVDAGGPLACRDPSTGRYILTGVATWALSCISSTLPDVYADVRAFVPLIQKVMTDI
ncbi:unnamed protein product [Meganyctiphanes norvegica]|uniref:Peptidase S1 domain-containing protein n=1 Tax=Meganyctiphanes norvegica TaxID=48144 RepID=A0AAV2SKF6_MEGNR